MNNQAIKASKHHKESMDKLIPFMPFGYAQEGVRPFDKALLSVAEGLTAHHGRNQQVTVRPEPVEGLNQASRVGNIFLPTIDDEIFLLPQAVGKKACPPCHTKNNNAILHAQTAHQSGAVLIISLIMLLLLTLIGTTGMQTTSLEEKMAGNMRDKNLAFQAAESALNAAEATLMPVAPAVLPTFDNAGTGGFYSATPTPNLSETEILKDSFWTTNPHAISTVNTLGNGIAPPVYIIQQLPAACFNPAGCPPNPTLTPYRITVRATGGSTNTVVILQSIYSR